MKYITLARSDEIGTAELPLMDKKTGKILNSVDRAKDTSILKFLDDRRTKASFTDISGCTVEMVITIDTDDGKTETGSSIVEILRVQGNNIIVRLDGKVYSVYKGVVTLYKTE